VRVAAVDIGTNTARLLIADVEGAEITDVVRSVEVVGLGAGVDRTGRIGDDAIRRAVPVLEEYGAAIDATVDRRRAVATSAMRDADNRAAVLDEFEEALGFRPDVIEGEEEAALAFAGAVTGVGAEGSSLVIDPGGGSTEFVFGTSVPDYATSVDMGSVRLTDRMLAERPAPTDAIDAARRHVGEMFAAVTLPGVADTVIGVAGTFTSLAAIALELSEYDRDRVHGTRLDTSMLEALIARLGSMSVTQTASIPSLDPKRAPVILSGAVIAAAALEVSGRSELVVSESDSLDGLVLDLSRA
jgi:exopolyphosphatase/guanosine-5'-triphosphate,3'-diphosphate pyrophosphatase